MAPWVPGGRRASDGVSLWAIAPHCVPLTATGSRGYAWDMRRCGTRREFSAGVALLVATGGLSACNGNEGRPGGTPGETDPGPGITSLTSDGNATSGASTGGSADAGTGVGSSGTSAGTGGDGTAGGGSATTGSAGGDGPDIKFDVGNFPDAPGGGMTCAVPEHVPCDGDDDIWHAIGVNCPGEPQWTVQFNGNPQQTYVLAGPLGTHQPPPFPPLEGEKILILSSGVAQELTQGGLYMSTDLGGFTQVPLPPPINPNKVSQTEDCAQNPALIGTGDCSNTIYDQWSQGTGAYDLAEMRMQIQVPEGAYGFHYDLAFFSTEYPVFYKSQYNDMYIAWLESETWTGNISFDEMGNPISLNAGFLDYKDAPNTYDCPAPCTAPELAGTAMEGHAGTKWLTTTAGVVPGETITLQFVIFDVSDGILDSTVILDDFGWDCEGGPPVTVPK
ncbi:MAG: hypothetical protein D6705_18545 [Deltaproteobacteria bacterium]|nr:MAG: hypothetical protein D6705_18545 [Deltaproteobacteria bacterium]